MDGKRLPQLSRSAAPALLSCAVIVGASGAGAQQCQPLFTESTVYAYTLPPQGLAGGGVFLDASGALYGWDGEVFRLTPPAASTANWTYGALSSVAGRGYSLGGAIGGVFHGAGGAFYGASTSGGAANSGGVFSLAPPASGSGPWTQTAIYQFQGGADGARPSAGLVADSFGALYGVMANSPVSRGGGVFRLALSPAGPQGIAAKTTLYAFSGVADGGIPYAPVVFGRDGALYGTTITGGAYNAGVVFKLTPNANPTKAWTETVIHSFDGADGRSPYSRVTFSADGSLYGTTYLGGSSNLGTVYKLTPPASGIGAWSETVVHSFSGGADGGYPVAGVIIDPWGALYGVAATGGIGSQQCSAGCGVAFRLTPPVGPATTWSETVLHSFTGPEGAYPETELVFSNNGGLYGTTASGGPNGSGVVFKVQSLNHTSGCL